MVNIRTPHVRPGVIGLMAFSLVACATELLPVIDTPPTTGPVVVGRIVAVLTGETSRWYAPEVRLIEVENQETAERFHIEIQSEDRHFVCALPPGTYQLTRVQINEGPFMSMANLDITFSVGESAVTYLGTWRFGISPPRYGRMVVVSIVFEEDELDHALDVLHHQVPTLREQPIVTMLPQPSQLEARLYEVMPYPPSNISVVSSGRPHGQRTPHEVPGDPPAMIDRLSNHPRCTSLFLFPFRNPEKNPGQAGCGAVCPSPLG